MKEEKIKARAIKDRKETKAKVKEEEEEAIWARVGRAALLATRGTTVQRQEKEEGDQIKVVGIGIKIGKIKEKEMCGRQFGRIGHQIKKYKWERKQNQKPIKNQKTKKMSIW